MSTTEQKKTVEALICSVGGTPAPIIYTINTLKPDYIAFVCSEDTRSLCGDILLKCNKEEACATHILLSDPQALDLCYREIRDGLKEVLKCWELPVEQIHVDYTGGTKTMSAAIVLVAAEQMSNFSYVGGDNRSKGGVGIVLDGREQRYIQSNPWKELAVREIEKAGILWNNQQYRSCANLLKETTGRIPQAHRKPFKTLTTVAEGLAARMAFHLHPLAKDRMHSACGNLLECHETTAPLRDFCLQALQRFEAFSRCITGTGTDNDYELTLAELLDNALLTAKMHRYEDACARLYRYMEYQAQVWLSKETAGAIHLGKLQAGKPIPEPLMKMRKVVDALETGKLFFALEDDFKALAFLGHPKAQLLVEDFQSQSLWRNATEIRNNSILAHGLQNVQPKTFTTYCNTVEHYFGVDLSHISLEPPRWNADWLLPPERKD